MPHVPHLHRTGGMSRTDIAGMDARAAGLRRSVPENRPALQGLEKLWTPDARPEGGSLFVTNERLFVHTPLPLTNGGGVPSAQFIEFG